MIRYWKQILFFIVLTAYFLYGLAPDMNWESIGADQMNYVVAAQHNAPAGLSGNPLYILLGSLLVRLPTNPFWSLGLLSALPAVGTCVVIFLTVSKFTKNAWAPYIASLVFASSFSVWAESVIAETYLLTAFVSSLVIYFCLTRKYYWMSAMMALGVGLHPLGIWVALPCLVFTWWRENRDYKLVGKVIGITLLGFIFRLRDLFTSPATTNLFFLQNPYENLLYSAGGYFSNSVVPIQPTIQRLGEDFIALGSSLWAIVLAVFTFKKSPGVILLWSIFGLAFFFPFASIYPQWIKYMFLPILPLSILVGLGIDKLQWRTLSAVCLVPCLVFMTLNVTTYSPGKTIDVTPTTARQFYYTLNNVPDNAVVVGHTWGHPDLVVLYYLVESGDRFSYVNYDSRDNLEYVEYQTNKGIVMPSLISEPDSVFDIPSLDYLIYGRPFTVQEFAQELQSLNPDRKVLVTYVESSEIPMEFGLISSSEYNPGLNDLPSGKVQFSG